jgi:Rod binding domain-containing protein
VIAMKINPLQMQTVRPLKQATIGPEQRLQEAEEVQKTFRTFVGEAFFGQMLKAMRSTQGKPAYFHGGHAEEVFRGQLDQELSKVMTEASADTIADPMFRQQFPRQAFLLEENSQQEQASLRDLNRLHRR